MIEILHRYTHAVIYRAETAESIADAVKAAAGSGANLAEANLAGAYLGGAKLAGANLTGADLTGANLAGAYLTNAYLTGANLGGANLVGANLTGAYLANANLAGAYLANANLAGADLTGAYLGGAKLAGAENTELAQARTSICAEGEIVGYKKTQQGIVKLRIPADSPRCNATGRKCRAAWAVVLETPNHEPAFSQHDPAFKYVEGETVRPAVPFDENRWRECATGIHFYITRLEAEAHR